MIIYMDEFFPTSQSRLKKLLKVINMDYENRDKHIHTMQQFFNDKLNELEEIRINTGKNVYEAKQEIANYVKIIESKKYPNGMKLSKDELKKVKRDKKTSLLFYQDNLSEYKRCTKDKKMFLKHLEILKQREW